MDDGTRRIPDGRFHRPSKIHRLTDLYHILSRCTRFTISYDLDVCGITIITPWLTRTHQPRPLHNAEAEVVAEAAALRKKAKYAAIDKTHPCAHSL